MKEAALQCGTLWLREMKRFVRQRSRVVGAFMQPLVFWLLLGAGLKASFRPEGTAPGGGFVEYFYPGVLILVLLFTAIFSTIATVEDRHAGFLQGVLVSPIRPAALVMGQALGGTTLGLMEGLIFLALAPLAGIPLGIAAIAASVAAMALVAFALTSLGLLIAWRIESTQGFHTIMNLILMPLWMLSGAFFPAKGAPFWLGWAMRVNPLTYGVAALRRSLYRAHPAFTGHLPAMGPSFAISLGFALVSFAAAAAIVRRSNAF